MNTKHQLPNFALILFLSALLCACTKKSEVDAGIRIIKVREAKNVNYNPLKDIVKRIELIPLETNSDNLLAFTQNIFFDGDNFIIMDHREKKVHKYSPDGKLLKLLDSKGKGPNEYSYINGVKKYDSYYYLLDYQKIIKYDLNFQPIESFFIEDHGNISDIGLIGLDTFVTFNNFSKIKEYSLINIYHKNKLIKDYGRIKFKDIHIDRFFNYNNSLNVIPPYYSRTILKVDKNLDISPKYKIDFGSQNLIIADSIKEITKGGIFERNKSNYNHTIQNFLETEKYLIFRYLNKGVKWLCLYNKETKECIITNKASYGNDILLSPLNSIPESNILIGLKDALTLKNHEVKPNDLLSHAEYEKIERLKIEDNPVIVKIYLE